MCKCCVGLDNAIGHFPSGGSGGYKDKFPKHQFPRVTGGERWIGALLVLGATEHVTCTGIDSLSIIRLQNLS